MAAKRTADNSDGYDGGGDGGGDGDGGGGGENGRILSLQGINDALADLAEKVERALSGRGGGPAASQPRNSEPGGSGRMTYADSAEARRREIREELAALKAQERADAERGDIMTRIGKVEKALERPPRQLRRIEEFMGWHR